MVTIELSQEQAAALKKSLELVLSDMRMEIGGTDDKDYREGLKNERALLESIAAQLPQAD